MHKGNSFIYQKFFMNRNMKYYKFINSETGNVIHFLSFPRNEPNCRKILEATRQKLAYENGIFLENIYYSSYSDSDLDE